jgi:hypothetical protein
MVAAMEDLMGVSKAKIEELRVELDRPAPPLRLSLVCFYACILYMNK